MDRRGGRHSHHRDGGPGGELEAQRRDAATALLSAAEYAREPVDAETPEHIFERRWALALLDQVLAQLRDDELRHLFAILSTQPSARPSSVVCRGHTRWPTPAASTKPGSRD